jgi:nucleotide-binding universal stress UspA family protein
MDINNIVVPIDFSEGSLAALKAAEDLARKFGAKLHLFHSHPINFAASSPYAPVLPPYYFEDLTIAAKNQLHDWRLKHCDDDLQVDEHLSELPAAVAIVEFAGILPADLIVIGTRGLTGLKHVLLGSVAERVVQRAPCPVMSVKTAEQHAEASKLQAQSDHAMEGWVV